MQIQDKILVLNSAARKEAFLKKDSLQLGSVTFWTLNFDQSDGRKSNSHFYTDIKNGLDWSYDGAVDYNVIACLYNVCFIYIVVSIFVRYFVLIVMCPT